MISYCDNESMSPLFIFFAHQKILQKKTKKRLIFPFLAIAEFEGETD